MQIQYTQYLRCATRICKLYWARLFFVICVRRLPSLRKYYICLGYMFAESPGIMFFDSIVNRWVDGKKYDKTHANDKDINFCQKIKRRFHNYYLLENTTRRINNSFDKYNIQVQHGKSARNVLLQIFSSK